MILEAKQIIKTYRNGNRTLKVLDGVNFSIDQGEIVTIMGPSGSGKSTLLNILGTLDVPDSGDIRIHSRDVMSLDHDQLAKLRNNSIGFVFQFHHLLPEFTAYENVLIPARMYSDGSEASIKADELFDYLGLGERRDHYPSELSGGERSRVAVLRAIINNPDLVLADEPTGNLDSKNAVKLLELFQQIREDFGKSFILTTHNPEVARIGNRSCNLENGKLENK